MGAGPIRILYILTTLAVGGTERQVLSLSRRMAARGHTVKLLVLKARESDGLQTDLDVEYLGLRKSAAGWMRGLREGGRAVRAFQPDVMHSHNFHGNMLARCLRVMGCRQKLISTIHNVYEGGRLRMLAYRLSDRWADLTTAVSGAVAERYVGLKAVSAAKCVVVTNGIEAAEFVPDPGRRAMMRQRMGANSDFIWVSVGRMTAAKDLPNLMQAFGRVWEARPRVQLWIAGEAAGGDSSKAEYFAVAMPQGALECVRRLGLRRDIAALLDAADGFVLSSAWEGMPLAVGEAMAMEKMVVATDVGGVRELVGDCGVVVPPKDAGALAAAMLGVMGRAEEERAAMGRGARERIEARFSMDAKGGEWEALYRLVIER